MEKKLQKTYLTDSKLLIGPDLLQAHYQILLIISLKEFMKLKVNTYIIIKNAKLVEFHTMIASAFLNRQIDKL